MSNSDEIITLSYSIKESHLEDEVSRLYDNVLKDIFSLGRDVPPLPARTLTYQSLDDIKFLRQQAADINRQLANVENIVTQYLQHKAVAPQAATSQQSQQQEPEPSQVDSLSMISSPYEQQRRLAKEIQKNNENTNKGYEK